MDEWLFREVPTSYPGAIAFLAIREGFEAPHLVIVRQGGEVICGSLAPDVAIEIAEMALPVVDPKKGAALVRRLRIPMNQEVTISIRKVPEVSALAEDPPAHPVGKSNILPFHVGRKFRKPVGAHET